MLNGASSEDLFPGMFTTVFAVLLIGMLLAGIAIKGRTARLAPVSIAKSDAEPKSLMDVQPRLSSPRQATSGAVPHVLTDAVYRASKKGTTLLSTVKTFDWYRNGSKDGTEPVVISHTTVKKLAGYRNPELYYLFGVQLPMGNESFASEVVIMDSRGSVVATKAFPGYRVWVAAMANSTTIYGLATASDTDWDWQKTAKFILYNMQTGTRVDIPLEGGTHWLEYDLQSQSFVWLKNRFLQINCDAVNRKLPFNKQTGAALACPQSFITAKVRHSHVVSDDIIETTLGPHSDPQESFRWDVFDSVARKKEPLFKFQPIPMRKWRGKSRGHPDYVHANCVFRDLQEDVVYLNSLSLSSIFKINRTSGRLIWVVGEHTNTFAMFDEHGNRVPRLFKLAHSLNYLGDDLFLIFDNEGATVDGEDGSRLVKFKVHPANRTARIVWQWTPPTKADNAALHRGNGGGTHPLLDGGVVAAFGQPWTQHLVEVQGDAQVMHVEISDAFVQDVAAFYDRPLVRLVSRDAGSVTVHCLNAFRELRSSPAALTAQGLCPGAGGPPTRHPFRFLPFWQPTTVTVPVPAGGVRLVLHNADGLEGGLDIPGPCT